MQINEPIRELAISGGGVRGIAFLGVVYELQCRGLLDLRKISGTSIGAFISVCVLIGYNLKHLIDIIFDYDFQQLKGINIKSSLKNKSLMSGDCLNDFFVDIISRKMSPETTLKELYLISKVELQVAVWCVNTEMVRYITHETDPDVTIIKLVRMATAIPFIYPPIEYDGNLYVDAGLVDNMPIISEDCWGITTLRGEKMFSCMTKECSYSEYISKLMKMLYSVNKDRVRSHKRLIRVDVGNILVTSFNITKDEKFGLIQSGIKAVLDMIND